MLKNYQACGFCLSPAEQTAVGMRLGFNLARCLIGLEGLQKWFSYSVQRISSSPIQKMSRQVLIAFDFDHTIVDGNTDVIVRNLISRGGIPQSTQELYRKGDWIDYMNKIFEHLHHEGVTPEQILDAIRKIPAVPGMLSLLQFLKRPDCETIIISDSNSVFISTWLKAHGLTDPMLYFYTNPANFDASGQLHVNKYHIQDWCKLSSVNLCKGSVLETHVNSRKEDGTVFTNVVYIGDGHNDYCPSLRLSANDIVFARSGFSLEKVIRTGDTEHGPVKARVYVWKSGDDILQVIKNSIIDDEIRNAT